MTASDVWQVVGLVALILTQAWIMWRWFIARQDALRTELVERADNAVQASKDAVDQCHSRINDVREEYVRQKDFDQHLARFETQLRDIGSQMRQQHSDINGRIDNVLGAINSLISNRAETPKQQ